MNLRWHHVKEATLATLNMSHDMAHIHLGLAAFLLLVGILRNHPHRFAIAWLALLLVTLGNEALDATDWVMWTGEVNWGESAKDILNTVLWPTALWALAPMLRRS